MDPQHRLSRDRRSRTGSSAPGAKASTTNASAVEAEAYIAGEQWRDPNTYELTEDHRGKTEVVYADVVIPDHVPEDARRLFANEPEMLFGALDAFEDAEVPRRNKQHIRKPNGRRVLDANGNPIPTPEAKARIQRALDTTHRLIIDIESHPNQFGLDSTIDAAIEHAFEYAHRGELGLFGTHAVPGNFHVHYGRSARSWKGEDFAAKLPWNSKTDAAYYEDLHLHRRLAADIPNRLLARLGYDARLDHRSYKDRGIPLRPTEHEGPGFHLAKTSIVGQQNSAAREYNAKKLTRQPELILHLLRSSQHAFLHDDVSAALRRRIPSADESWLAATAAMLASSEHVERIGSLPDGAALLMAKPTWLAREALRGRTQLLSERASCRIEDPAILLAMKDALRHSAAPRSEALMHLVQGPDVAVVLLDPSQSRGGALDGALAAWEAQGRPRLGVAPTPLSARTLAAELHIPALSFGEIAPHPMKGRNVEPEQVVPQGAVVIVDEAEACDILTLSRLAAATEARDGKLVVLADPAALGGHDAGYALRTVAQAAPVLDLTIERRREVWFEQALAHLTACDMAAALEGFNAEGALSYADDPARAMDAAETFLDDAVCAKATAAIVVSTPEQANAFNDALRERLRGRGHIEADERSIARCGRRTPPLPISIGDRVVIPQATTAGQPPVRLRAGTTGTVSGFEPDALILTLDDGRRVGLDTTKPIRINHAWALTAERAKDVSTDRTMLAVLDQRLDRQLTSRVLARAKERAVILTDRSQISDRAQLVETLGRDGARQPSPEHIAATQAERDSSLVRDFLRHDRRMARMATDMWKRTDDIRTDRDWPLYQTIERDRLKCAVELVCAKPKHRRAASALGADWGAIERAAGRVSTARAPSLAVLEKRHPTLNRSELNTLRLSLVQDAQSGLDRGSKGLLDRLVGTASEHRELYRTIRAQSGAAASTTHPRWTECEQLRQTRNRLAALAARDPATFRPALVRQGRRWRDVERWAKGKDRDELALLWERGLDRADAHLLGDYAHARADGAFERKAGRDVAPHRARRNEAAVQLTKKGARLLPRADEIGIEPLEVREVAAQERIRQDVALYHAAKGAGREEAFLHAHDVAQALKEAPRAQIRSRAHLLEDAAEFERRVPARERKMATTYLDPKRSDAERATAAKRWSDSSLTMAWLAKHQPAVRQDIDARMKAQEQTQTKAKTRNDSDRDRSWSR